MVCFRFIFILVSVLPNLSNGMQVDMKGSLSLGKEVVNVLKSFISAKRFSGRKSGGGNIGTEEETEDLVTLIVYSSFICRDIDFCKGHKGRFLSQYIIALTKTVQSVLIQGLIYDNAKNEYTSKAVIFEKELRPLLGEIKKMLRNASQKITEDNKTYIWIDLIKRINSLFQDTATTYATQRLEGNVREITQVKKNFTQKLIIATVDTELQFDDKLCIELEICSKSHQITEALHTFLVKINNASDQIAKEFMRQFSIALPSTNFYYRISDVTGHEFQTILHDMAYAENIATKPVLKIIEKIVEERLNAMNSKIRVNEASGMDVKLIHVILSDMDHFYSNESMHKKGEFHEFLKDFFEWIETGGKFTSQIRQIMKDLQNNLSFESDELVRKLVNEMRVFLEITVDSDS